MSDIMTLVGLGIMETVSMLPDGQGSMVPDRWEDIPPDTIRRLCTLYDYISDYQSLCRDGVRMDPDLRREIAAMLQHKGYESLIPHFTTSDER
jgi:hypothetical protein